MPRFSRYSFLYPVSVILIWTYPLSIVFAKPFWSFLYLDLLRLSNHILKHVLAVGFILMATFSGIAFLLHVVVWAAPRIRRHLRPHWSTHIAAFAALWLFLGTTGNLLMRRYPFISVPPTHEEKKPGATAREA